MLLGGALTILFGCAAPQDRPALSLRRVDPATLPGWGDDHLVGLLPALLGECRQLALLPAETPLGGIQGTDAGGKAGLYGSACRAASALPGNADENAVRGFFEHWFLFYAVGNGSDENARFTGYFEPEVAGSLASGPGFRVPVYARPVELGPPGTPPQARWTRAEIDRGALSGRGLELLWLHDPVDLFVLQMQGSGRVRLPSGQSVRLRYDGRNGQPYVPLGRVLVEQGVLPADGVTLPAIRNWLETHPADARTVMERNPNYVFFREEDALMPSEGPPGTLGVPLSPLRSAAVDRAFLPLAAPLFISTVDADGRPVRRLMLAQDTGADVQGPARADLFFGWGGTAEDEAGRMRADGMLFLLLPRQPDRP